ncbi:MAG: TonB family protein [Methylovulum sp.]|nr:TonB family protein [Methylovulum sp.]
MVFFNGGKDRANRPGPYVFSKWHTHPLIAKINALSAIFMAKDRTYAMGILLSVLVMLIHVWIALTLIKPNAPSAKIKPVMIEVSLLAAPAPEKNSAPVAEKKAPPPQQPKIAPVIRKPAKVKTAPAPKKPPIIQKKAALPEPTAIAAPPAAKPVPLPLSPTAEATTAHSESAAIASKAAASPKVSPAIKENGHATCVSCPKIKYPVIAQRRGWEGRVLLKLQLSPDGQAVNITIERSSGHSALDEAAIANAKQSRFTVGNTGQIRIATKLFEFKLDQ